MGFRFQRRISFGKHFRINLSKSGVSESIGTCGAWFTIAGRAVCTILLVMLVAARVAAAPAVRLEISDCSPAPPPVQVCPPVFPIHSLGRPVSFWISAVDASGQMATNYTGGVVFSSSDSAAVLPQPHTFTASDNSVFFTAVTFNTPSSVAGAFPGTNRQDVSATDATNGLSTTAAFLLSGGPVSQVPTLAAVSLVMLTVAVTVAGFIAITALRARA
jgi:uncharacterized protein DUF4236